MRILIRLVIAAAALEALVYFNLLDIKMLLDLAGHPQTLALALGLLLISFGFGAVRWHLLLNGLGVRLPFSSTLNILLIGQFFSTFLPGAYGGDLVRTHMVLQQERTGLSRILLSILIDRLLGLVGLISLGMLAVFLMPPELRGNLVILGPALTLTILVGLVVASVLGEPMARLFERVPKIGLRLASFSREVSRGLRSYAARWWIPVVCWLLSIALFTLVVSALVVVANNLNLGSLSHVLYALSGVIALLANAIPLTPGGIGIGEAAFSQAAHMLEIVRSDAPYATIFLAYRALTVAASLSGVLAYLLHRAEVDECCKATLE